MNIEPSNEGGGYFASPDDRRTTDNYLPAVSSEVDPAKVKVACMSDHVAQDEDYDAGNGPNQAASLAENNYAALSKEGLHVHAEVAKPADIAELTNDGRLSLMAAHKLKL